MKKNIILFFTLLTAQGMFPSCEEWLDVKPKIQIESDVLFETETGFKDALWGIYTNMSTPEAYGREMTFGLVDAIGKIYSSAAASSSGIVYTNAINHDYTNSQVESQINKLWQKNYNSIANLNNLIACLKTADRQMFFKNNHGVILGEALGLRAFLHFDLLRLFAPSYKVGASEIASPYVTTYGKAITPQITVSAVIDSVLVDLTNAALALHETDPIVTGEVITSDIDDGYLLDRNLHMNYYAVKALMARVYLYKGDLLNAAACADEVIHSGKFTWTPVDRISVSDAAQRDRTFTPEQVFALHVDNMYSIVYNFFMVTNAVGLLVSTTYLNRIYPHANDWRRLFYWSGTTSATAWHCNKLWQPSGMPAAYACRVPLIRLPELYLISAEATFSTNPENTRACLNEVKAHRGIADLLPDGTLEATLQNEIKQEYLREFICEGVMFFYYKRLDIDRMEGITKDFDKTKYVLPMPAEEIEFGQRDKLNQSEI
jgi:hypothetical protein